MPSSQAAAAERRNDRTITHEPPKLKTILKTPPKQATNPMQFVKVGPCSLYRTAQEQLQKVQEVKKIKQEVRDDPEDWQSNLDNWKSSRRKRQEHIIERVVEVKKLELEEHDRQRRRSKTFSEMMEERGSRGRKLSMSLAMYHEEDSNDLSDLGIGTSSGKSSVSGDTHDDTQSVLSDRDSEIDKNHSDIDNAPNENGNGNENNNGTVITNTSSINPSTISNKKPIFGSHFHDHDQREYDSGTTATASSPEPEEYNYMGASCGYVNRDSQSIPGRLINFDMKFNNMKLNHFEEENLIDDQNSPGIKVDIHKRREIFEKASQKNSDIKINNNNNNNNNISNRSSGDYSNSISIKERLSSLEKQKQEADQATKTLNRLSGDMSTIRERLCYLEKQTTERDNKAIRKPNIDDFESVQPLHERIPTLEKYSPTVDDNTSSSLSATVPLNNWQNDEFSTKIKDRLGALDVARSDDLEIKPADKANCHFPNQETRNNDNSTPSERSSSPDSEYRAPRAAFHRSLDSLDADASSGPDTFERVQSLEELDYVRRRYPASASSAEILNDTDREDSGIHTADVSCSVSQADEPVDEEIVQYPGTIFEVQEIIVEAQQQQQQQQETTISAQPTVEFALESPAEKCQEKVDTQLQSVVIIEGTAETTGIMSTNKYRTQSFGRTVIYQSPRVPPRRTPPVIKCDYLNDLALKDSNEFESNNALTNSPDSKPSIDPNNSVNKPSKIPTPLPRKPTNNIKVCLPSASTSFASSAKTPPKSVASSTPFIFAKATKIPSPLKVQDDSLPAPPLETNHEKNCERRRTIVEVCEKVIVSHGQMPVPSVTPFITVTKINDEQQQQFQQQQQQRASEESIVIGSSSTNSNSSNEEAKPRSESPTPVEHEKEEVQTNESTTDIQSIDTTTVVCPMLNVEQKVHRESPVTLPVISMVNDTTVSDPLIFEILSAERAPVTNNMEFIGTPYVLSNSIPPLNLTSDEEIVAGLTFPLGPLTRVEPPKEKPPPPPTDFSDEENQPIEPLKRLNSTRRIKKELRTRRSDFLGIEGIIDDDFELSVAKPPDMAAILAEERRIEQLHRRSYDTDSNYEQDSSHERDSGVELGHAEDWSKQPVSPDMSEHSRQSSEPFGASVTSSEEDEITKKEREIIEVLEKEEQWRYGNDREQNSDIGEKLAHKLRELEEEKMQLERERAQDAELHRQEETLWKNDKNARKHDQELLRKQQEEDAMNQQENVCIEELNLSREVVNNEKDIEEEEEEEEEQLRIKAERLRLHDEMMENKRRSAENRRQEEIRLRSMEDQLRKQEKSIITAVLCNREEDEYASGEILRVERELLQLEREELKRKRSNMAYREQQQKQLTEQLQEQWQSLQDVNNTPNIAHATYQNINMINYRSSMPNLQLHDVQRRRPAPPPIPPAKPIRLLEQRQRDVTIRNSRIPSADSIPQQVDAAMRHSISATALATHAGQQMTRQTLQALSAVPRTRIVKSDQWVQRRKSDGPRIAQDYNYQHWLIQEAEQRRINEKNQRSAVRKPQQHVTGTSVLYTATSSKPEGKPLPDSIIQTLTQRMQNRAQERPPPPRRRMEHSVSQEHLSVHHQQSQHHNMMHHKVHQSPAAATSSAESQEKMLSVSGKKKCSHCGDELGRGAAMIIESLRLFYHMECFKCCVCHVRLGDGLMGTDVRVRNHKLHCHNCYSSDDGVKFSCV